jgi:hypothetical protein
MKWMPYRIGSAVCAGDIQAPVWPFVAIRRNAPKTSTEHSLKSMMLGMADGHTRPQSATCPLWMAILRIYLTFATVNKYFGAFSMRFPFFAGLIPG